MRNQLSKLIPLMAGLALTVGHSAGAADGTVIGPGYTETIDYGTGASTERDKPVVPAPGEAVPPATDDLNAPASTGGSRPAADEAPPNETDAERADRIKEKFRQRPGYRNDPPEPQASLLR
jgi:hypothetical protein